MTPGLYMNKEDRRLGNDRKTLLVEDCVNVRAKEYGILGVIDGFKPRVLLIRVSKHTILAEPALFAPRN
jgi:hypothetical protein